MAFVDTFSRYQHVVAPSGSCVAMVNAHFDELFEGNEDYRHRAAELAKRTTELSVFLARFSQLAVDQEFAAKVAYHDSCSGLRELNIRDEPRRLLRQVKGLEFVNYVGSETCCGFGGTFCVKYPEVSVAICSSRCQEIEDSGADTLLGGDLGCLMNLAGRLNRNGCDIDVRHYAEVLSGVTGEPAICKPVKK